MNNSKEYEYITFLVRHKELFTYDTKRKMFYDENHEMSIGNKYSLKKALEDFGKDATRDVKDNVSKQLDKFNSNDLIALDMRNKMEICIYPIADFLTEYGYIEMLRKEEKDDKFIAGTIESEYDNYFSVEEEADEKEEEIDY